MKSASLLATALLVHTSNGLRWEEHDFRVMLGNLGQVVPVNQCPAWATPVTDLHFTASSGVCLPPSTNLFLQASGNLLKPVPYPHSAYHYILDSPLFTYSNGAGVASSTVAALPRVSVSILKNVDPTSSTLVPSTEWAYHWQDFDEHRNDRVWSLLSPLTTAPGVYKVQLNAHDYFVDSGVCELCFTVTDRYRPKSSSLCPATPGGGVALGSWSAANVATLDAYLDGVSSFVGSRGNNANCNTPLPAGGSACDDTNTVTPTDWFSCPLATALGDFIPADFAGGATGCVGTILATDPLAANVITPNFFNSPSVCTRTVTFAYKWYEYWSQFSCASSGATGLCTSGADGPNSDYGPNGGDESGVTSSSAYACANTVSLSATADDLVASATVSGNPSLTSNVQFISDPATVFAEPSYTALGDAGNTQIHFWSPSNAAQDADLDVRNTITVPIQSVFSTTALGGPIAGLTLPAAPSLVSFRWSTTTPPTWKRYSANENLVLTDFATTVTFEAWTHCGQKGSAVTWTVYNHRHQSIQNVDEWFQPQWSYVSKPRCNVPHSDFGVVQFAFDVDDLNARIVNLDAESDKPIEAILPPTAALLGDTNYVRWFFNSVKCAWKYGEALSAADFTLSDYAWSISADDFASTGSPPNYTPQTFQFAPKLLNQGVTKVSVYCDFFFTDTLKANVVTVYRDASYVGDSKSFPVGAYDLPSGFLGTPTPANGVSSLKVAPGYKVTLYQDFNQRGSSISLTADTPSFLVGWDNLAKSIRVTALPGTTGINSVTIHTDKNFVFENCDRPTWADAYFPTGETCVGNCKTPSWLNTPGGRVAAPFQASGGNLIFPAAEYTAAAPIGTTFHVGANYACCSACDGAAGFGASITSVSAPWTAGSPISRCQPSNYAPPNPIPTQVDPTTNADPDATPVLLAFADMMSTSSSSSSLAVLVVMVALVGVVAAVVFHQSSKARQFVALDDAYTSLTDPALY
ncbi:hypothetical protein H257_15971 [Aphanomyces astaci]|uniref:Uncharacterized protein n=1 Tax=Aphanomyces astaci TaxID=112090 RepID=W4FMG5_APHAT|nr:hypothetical protein H257_15971 [Aphanomyces astaci]ETV68019.1 hypothetical protein H257_15971 [Aphanomyces astaci]RQM24281.1 hypothetical protein B5M09_006048 [Aphanomyces astaci]|eukprot:XP_009842582.1 hypothetical protein H257_15971 [Aphanomyces astaci]